VSDQTVKPGRVLYCDIGKHIIIAGNTYLIRDNGAMSCADHRDAPYPETMLAGSLA